MNLLSEDMRDRMVRALILSVKESKNFDKSFVEGILAGLFIVISVIGFSVIFVLVP